MKKNKIFTTQNIALVSIFISMSAVLKAYGSIMIGADMRISFFDIPLLFTGVVFGPALGAVAGFLVDWLYIIKTGFPYSYLMALSTIMWGLIPGIYFLIVKKINVRNLAIIFTITSLVAFGLNTLQLYLWTGEGVFVLLPYRLGLTILKIPLQVYIIHLLYYRVYKRIQE